MAASVVVPRYNVNKKRPTIDYGNNVFAVKPTLLAQGLMARCLQWVSNDAFLFLGKDNAVYLWRQGIPTKVHEPIPAEFCYVVKSPLNAHPVVEHEEYTEKAMKSEATKLKEIGDKRMAVAKLYARDRTEARLKAEATARAVSEKRVAMKELKSKWSQLFEVGAGVKFTVGTMGRFMWGDIGDNSTMLVIPENEPVVGTMEKVWVEGKSIEDIDDPSQYFDDKPSPERALDKKGTAAKGDVCRPGRVEITRFSKLPGKYFGVELVETKADKAIYKKRAWPDKGPDSTRVAPKEQP